MIALSRGEIRESLGARSDVQRLLGKAYFHLARWNRLNGSAEAALRHGLEAWRWLGSGAIGVRRNEIRTWLFQAGLGCGNLGGVAENPLRLEFMQTDMARSALERFRQLPVVNQVRMRHHTGYDPLLPGNLIILKRPDHEEKGVILIKYTHGIEVTAALFDLPAMAERYVLVLEPSSWGYQDPAYLMYAGSDIDVVVEAPAPEDFDFIRDLESNLYPVRIGAGDWADPRLFQPQQSKVYDLIAVSGWNPLKRHRDLFEALASIRRRRGLDLRVALVGYDQGWTREDITRLMHRYGLEESCTIHHAVPYPEVGRLLAQSRAYVLMSRREGANKAMYESLFSDVPVIVYRHHRGINLDHVNEQTGILYDDNNLADAILTVVENSAQFNPRRWAEESTGCYRSTAALESVLRRIAVRRGTRWTRGIVPKANSPNLRYASEADLDGFADAYEDLAPYLRV